MKIKAWDMMADTYVMLTASLTTDHPCSSYGQPVMLIEEWEDQNVMSHQNWILAGCEAIEMEKSEEKDFAKWYSMIDMMR